ncbi:SGNH/GDSL hydrolase family protein [Aeromicrobium sp. Root472D3]|uniref:SGNH/GDSL hydrolase family protein n=1 Tax=Aeromicrobium sp. Root472D3 TaxID=1736540 RepID=UPI0006FEF534|nr:SGNH/GDSL hydrolase family protein [Aeromicrobium sp. Root472D3]KQX76214.1 SGNH hydrolase [Aeromicrobium sp. Root472D3]
MKNFHRFVAVGDSWTEGVGDPDPTRPNGLRGWADRVAEVLATRTDDFGYANFAIRGHRVGEIVEQQLGPALDLRPDLLTLQGAGNDILRTRVDLDALVGEIDTAVGRANDVGATVVLFTHGSPASGPFAALRGRIAIFNELVREVVDTRDAVLVDNWRIREARDTRLWDVDRVHLSPLGHHRAALEVLDVLGVPHEHPVFELSVAEAATRQARLRADLGWARTFVGPWAYRRLTGRSTGDGVQPKRPGLSPM